MRYRITRISHSQQSSESWKISLNQGLVFAPPNRYFASLGWTRLLTKPTLSAEPPGYVIRMPSGVGMESRKASSYPDEGYYIKRVANPATLLFFGAISITEVVDSS
jgi:hypothetical protein